jgi:hypothetical protein
LSEEGEKKLADQRMWERDKDQEECTEREHQLAEQERAGTRVRNVKEEPGTAEEHQSQRLEEEAA